MNGLSNNVYAAQRLGVYTFNNAVTGSLIGNPYGAFLLGIPDKTQLNTVLQPDSDGYARAYAVYVQDDWKLTPHLTLNYGLRWEYHPMFDDRLVNGTNFLINEPSGAVGAFFQTAGLKTVSVRVTPTAGMHGETTGFTSMLSTGAPTFVEFVCGVPLL